MDGWTPLVPKDCVYIIDHNLGASSIHSAAPEPELAAASDSQPGCSFQIVHFKTRCSPLCASVRLFLPGVGFSH